MPNLEYAQAAEDYLKTCMEQQDSAGGVIECVITGLPVGIGEPVFEKLDARLAQAILSIGAVKGIEIGDGFAASASLGSSNNDAFYIEGNEVCKRTNHSGGVLGGLSDGSPLVLRAAVKPTPSISQPQQTVTNDGQNTTLIVTGRHDPVIVPRAVVVVESMAAITIADLLMTNMTSQMEHLKKFYK